MKKSILQFITGGIGTLIFIWIILYYFQEQIIFHPEKLSADYAFSFDQQFEEFSFAMEDDTQLNSILFKADSSVGLIFYLHGNAGSLRSWGNVASDYAELNYDVFMLDYRGFGKSEGSINSQQQIFSDVQTCYDQIKDRYREDRIIVLGYSIGTGPAANLAANNQPGLLILQAPYYSLTDMMNQNFTWVPDFLLKYPMETFRYVKDCLAPIAIFHGNEDQVIPYESSVKLQKQLKATDRMITLEGQGHNGMSSHPTYIEELKQVLASIK